MNRGKREAFDQRLRGWAARVDVQVHGVAVRKMRKKWASCSMAGRLTFDESLLRQPSELQDYVIVYELLHRSVPNHGRLWKSLMRAYLGEYEALERRLQRTLTVASVRPHSSRRGRLRPG